MSPGLRVPAVSLSEERRSKGQHLPSLVHPHPIHRVPVLWSEDSGSEVWAVIGTVTLHTPPKATQGPPELAKVTGICRKFGLLYWCWDLLQAVLMILKQTHYWTISSAPVTVFLLPGLNGKIRSGLLGGTGS